ncbi:MAG TPA: DNA repair protein RecO [Candidatus Paceibacterota bacterium]
MSHHIYTTPGFVILSKPYGESGKFFLIFTRDLGMIGATAQGVRLSLSKLRYHVKDYSYNLFSLVRGKEVWRLTGAKDIAKEKIINPENRKLYVLILSLLKRFMHGEEKNEKLFEIIHNLYAFLSRKENKDKKELIEYLTVLRILHCLGYISNKNYFKDMISSSIINEDILNNVQIETNHIIKDINNALKESQL